ncbi:MAG TPA: PolC-type DNA polymerase III [Candidatus Onthomonas avicola]|nr:PolC-type DNA polymerase III [Candidatus Onthomonas avicola]
MALQNPIPLLQFFRHYQPTGGLQPLARDCTLREIRLHPADRSADLVASFSVVPDPRSLRALETVLAGCYGMSRITIRTPEAERTPEEGASLPSEAEPAPADEAVPLSPAGDGEPPSQEESAPPEEESAEDIFRQTAALREAAIRQSAQQNPGPAARPRKQRYTPAAPPAEMIFGKGIRRRSVPMGEVSLDMGIVAVTGKVFFVEHRELQKRRAWVINFYITDYTNSLVVSRFLENKQAKPILERVKKGMYVTVEGKLSISSYSGELELSPYSIAPAPAPEGRRDNAPEKRVELHLHTRFSTMDGLTEVKDAVKRAISWGHSAIAITDHGVAQAFPDAWHAAGDKIKILYGVEAYYINDVDDRVVVHGDSTASLDGEIVCFDIETTGLNRETEYLTEIGAVVLKDGEITERYNTFVNPGKPIPWEVVRLTGITDEMVADAPSQSEALNDFLDWVGDRPLAAHNADFDMGFLALGCERMGRPFPNSSIDTLILAQNLLPDLGKYKLDIVANHLNLPEFNHHRASDDAATVGYMLIPFRKMLADLGVTRLDQINPVMRTMRHQGRRRQRAQHLIVLAKNQTGLRNLYKLISLAHLEHFKRYPIMPKSVIDQNREGLILGSACEAGELFQAIVDHKSYDELRRIARWYDFLEIQPICNNRFLIGAGKAKDEEELRGFNRLVLRLAKDLDKPCCATGDVHFLDPEDEAYRHILQAAQGFEDADKELPIYFKTTEEMLEEFAYLGEEDCHKVVIGDPNRVAKWCDNIPPLPRGLFAPKLENSAQELENLVYSKAHELYGEELPQIVQDRIDLELPGIIMRKYDVIYMSAQKLVADSLAHGYLVGSRGSVGSSLVAFLSGITEVNGLAPHYRCPKCKFSDFDVDPVKYGCGADLPDRACPICGTMLKKDGFNIPFETFLGYGGTKVPDIDLNFSGEYQSSAHRYTFELFGQNHVFRAGTVGTVAEKTAYGYVLKYMEERGKKANKAELTRLASGCVGIKRTTGQHPGGMVVIPGDKEIYDFCPVQHPADDPNTDIVTTHFEYHSMEENLLKLDMLGHDDPTMIRMLQDVSGIDPIQIPLDDRDTMSIFCSSKVLGYEDDPILGPTGAVAIPEFGTSFTRQMLVDTQPKDFNTLVRLSGFSHGTDVWLGNAKDLILSGTATVAQVVGCRDDIMIYLIQKGIEPLKAFKFMEAVRKGAIHKGKPWPEGIEEEMRAHDIPEWYIESCRKIKYLFPKAHAVAYVMMAFRIAWFKVHDPLAFYAAYFSIRAKALDATCMCLGLDVCKQKMDEIRAKEKTTDIEDKMLVTLEVCYEFYIRGFTFAKMDLYRSGATRFQLDRENNALIPPFTACPGLGEAAAQSIVDARQGRTFISVEELNASCPKLSKAHIDLLRYMGALDGMPDTSQITFF